MVGFIVVVTVYMHTHMHIFVSKLVSTKIMSKLKRLLKKLGIDAPPTEEHTCKTWGILTTVSIYYSFVSKNVVLKYTRICLQL